MGDLVLERDKRVSQTVTFDFGIISLWFSHQKRSRLPIERVCGVWISEQLRQEDLEDVDHIEHWRPGLVDNIQADRTRPA